RLGRGFAPLPRRPDDPGATEQPAGATLAVVPPQPRSGRSARDGDHAAGDDRGGDVSLERAADGEPPAGRGGRTRRPEEPLGLVRGPGPGRTLQRPARPAVRRPGYPGPGRPPGRLLRAWVRAARRGDRLPGPGRPAAVAGAQGPVARRVPGRLRP